MRTAVFPFPFRNNKPHHCVIVGNKTHHPTTVFCSPRVLQLVHRRHQSPQSRFLRRPRPDPDLGSDPRAAPLHHGPPLPLLRRVSRHLRHRRQQCATTATPDVRRIRRASDRPGVWTRTETAGSRSVLCLGGDADRR